MHLLAVHCVYTVPIDFRNKPKWKQTTLRLYFVQSKQFKSMEMESAGPSTELKQNEKDEDGTNIVEIRCVKN